jgi:xanthine dehydrogenase accessory factor
MTDLARILSAWRKLENAGVDYVLASVVAVQGPSYRKPGALMLLTPEGGRIGTVSGGCLEAEVASRAWWLTANGPTIQRYSTADDDGDRPYGSGCGGVVFLLLERRPSAAPLLEALERAFELRISLAVATALDGPQMGRRAFAYPESEQAERDQSVELNTNAGLNSNGRADDESLRNLASRSMASRESMESEIEVGEVNTRVWANYRPARAGLWIFGAGDDAQPLLRLAKELGWFVSVADGRSQLATGDRFAAADQLSVLPIKRFPAISSDESIIGFNNLHREDAAVVMTHSFEQDSKILAWLLALKTGPAYIGVLGPQRRTRELLIEAGHLLSLPPSSIAAQADHWLDQLHAPTGLDLGAESPETIALSVLAEIQKVRTSSTALPLRTVRAATESFVG